MSRPVPIILSAVLLGLVALMQLLAFLFIAGVGFFTLHHGLPGAPAASPFPPTYMPYAMFANAVFFLGLAVWSILTLVGLARLRTWARYSILVMAGLGAGFGLIGVMISLATPILMRGILPASQGTPPHFSFVFLVMGVLYLFVIAIWTSQLIYYNLAGTRALFLQNAPISLEPPNTSTGRPRPVAITILSWFFLLSGPFCLFYLFLPLPAYFFGVAFSGIAARLIHVMFGAVGFAIGYGLFRLYNAARIALFVWIGVGFLNMLAIFTPWGTRNFQAYMEKFMGSMSNGTIPHPPMLFAPSRQILFSLLFAVPINLVIIWLVQRHRIAFTPAPPPPPMPDFSAPLA